MTQAAAGRPLDGTIVLDLSSLLPGPYASLLLADMGAHVIKVESRMGDLLRQFPPLVGDQGAYFRAINRNKRSLGLDLRKPEAKSVLKRMAARAHVVVESFRPGRMERMGLGPSELHAVNPGLVYCRLSGFGQSGPDSHTPGHDLGYQARAGILGLTDPPRLPAIQVADFAGGLTAAFAIAAALVEVARGGSGRVLDLSILEAAAGMAGFHLLATATGAASGAAEPLSGRYPFYNIYPTANGGNLAVGCLEPIFWRDFCQAVGHPEWTGRQFTDGADRAELFQAVARVVAERTDTQWRALIAAHDLAAALVVTPSHLSADPQLLARGAVRMLDDPECGRLPYVAGALGASAPEALPSPGLGEHTSQVLLRDFEFEPHEVDNLMAGGVVFGPSLPGRRIAPTTLP